MAEIDWRRVGTDAFQEDDGRRITMVTATVAADSEEAEALVLDPRPLLIEGAGQLLDPDWQVDETWTVSVERSNAEVALGLKKGPRKIIIVWILLRELSRAIGVAYRVPDTEAEQA